MAVEKLRHSTQPIDVTVLDATVESLYSTESSKEQRAAADSILRDLKANPDTWLQVVHILQSTRSTHTKYFALLVLEDVIKYRWNALTVEQRDGMKNYISEVIVKLSTDEASFRSERLYVNKLNVVLLQIVKQEWPAKWRIFIPDLVEAAKTSKTICENCMVILKLLSEEVFDFSRGEMTQQKIKELKEFLNSEFHFIHELFLNVLSTSQRPKLMRATLSALHAYLSWIPFSHIFDSPLLETLLRLFTVQAYRNLSLQCLLEVAARNPGDLYNLRYVNMYSDFIRRLQAILPLDTNIPAAYSTGTSEDQAFIQNLALFITSFFKLHIRILESAPENVLLLRTGLEYLTSISYVDDTEVFKMDFLRHIFNGFTKRQKLYSDPMSKLRGLMLSRMTNPEEVLIVEEETGNLVETMKDNDVLLQFKLIRETLIHLSHLDHDDTVRQMLSKLSEQISELSSKLLSKEKRKLLSKENRPWDNLNTLCCAIGSISGSLGSEQENRFMEKVINDLCSLCAKAKENDDKAVIATNIIYVVSQYSRFLIAHWMILKTVVLRLFDYMYNNHPGVKDMACDTFLKLAQQCNFVFVIVQLGEREPFLSEILSRLTTIVEDLEPHQFFTFYESVGCMIQAESDPQKRADYLERLMGFVNKEWAEIIGKTRQSTGFLKDPDVIRSVVNIIKTNTRVATSLGTYFFSQISLIFLDMLDVYRLCSELVSSSIADGGPSASRTPFVKLLRSVKREILKLIEMFLDKAENLPHIGKQFVPPMMDPVLGDYARNVWDARESEVLSLFATIINKYKVVMQDEAPQIFEAVLQYTLEMITKNFEDYPEHCLKFFSLLRAIATFCDCVQLSSEQLKLVMDSVIWAVRHVERNIAETGLNLLLEMLKKFQKSDLCNQFYRTYFMKIEQEIFAVLTDTFHKSGFKLHVLVLQHLFSMVESGSLTEPLWDTAMVPHSYLNNAAFVRQSTIKLLSSSFPNMTTSEVTQFVNGLYDSRSDLGRFKNSIRDFLIQSKQFSADQDNKDLYAVEAIAHMEKEREKKSFLFVTRWLIHMKNLFSESDLIKLKKKKNVCFL